MYYDDIYYEYYLYPKVLTMNDDGRFDIDLEQLKSYIDTSSIWDNQEKPSLNLINLFLKSKVEIKNMIEARKCFFIEYYITPDIKNKEIIKPSGIVTSLSEFYILTTKINFHVITTEMLRWVLKNKEMLNIKDEDGNYDKYPTNNPHGLIIPHDRLLELENKFMNDESARKIIYDRFVKKK